ncbi:MAG: hypothetical protein KC501_31295 [Myxococcales bacterium]|nr:hypothetical protein [Myxococcales bacterium]
MSLIPCTRAAMGSLALLLVGCPPRPPEHPETVCVRDCVQAPTSGLDGQREEINLLLCGLLTPSKVEDTSYSFFVYLYFADSSSYTKRLRYQAAAATLQLWGDVVDKADVEGLPPSLAILYVPVGTEDEQRLRDAARSATTLLETYDYDRARGLGQVVERSTGLQPPRVGLIASKRPLGGGEVPDLDQLYLVSLEVGLDDVERRILGFRDELISPTHGVDEGHADAATLSRSYFERLLEALGGNASG